MRSRRIACLLLGMWLAGSLLITAIAVDSLGSADRILANHNAAVSPQLKTLGPEQARGLLHYAAAEQTERWLEEWEDLALVFGVFLFFFLLFGTHEGKWSLGLALAMALVAACQRFVTSHLALQAVQWLLGAALAALLVTNTRRGSEGVRNKVDPIDKANYRHIDR